MRYNSELLEIYVVISGNVLLFKDIKILGAFNYCTENARSISGKLQPRNVNNYKVSAVEPKFRANLCS